ncbi:MAG TPA: hypothetical protein VFW03_14085 [Gemmatimonadaceae bacterium]|nr:hypothetical protein [Gemmatimonadaceae bacterium]
MRVRITHLVLLAAAATAACRDDQPEIAAPASTTAVSRGAREFDSDGPLVRITSPVNDDVVAGGEGQPGAGSLTGGSGFTIIVQAVTKNATDVSANESANIRNTALLGQPNPNFPGLSVQIDADMITPDGTIIPRNTNLANLFNTLGTDDSPGDGVTIWAGWHVLESFPDDVKHFTITATVRDAQGHVGTDVVRVKVDKHGTSGQALTAAPTTVTGDGLDDAGGPLVALVGPRDPSSVALGTDAVPAFTFFQVSAFDRSGAGIGVNENGDGITAPATPVGLIRDPAQFASAGANRNFPGLVFTFDVDFRRGNGVIVPAGQNLAPAFDIAGSTLDHRGNGNVTTTASWVAGGRFVMPAGKTTVTVTARVTDNAGKTGSVSRTFGVSPVANGQLLTPQP